MTPRRPIVGYLLKTFPKLSETFILNEMLELERQGINLHIFSLRQPTDRNHHPAVSQLKAPVTYLPSLLPEWDLEEESQLIENQIAWSRRHPMQMLETLQFYCDRLEERRFNEFLQGCYLATEMQRLNIDHLHVHFANIPAATAEIAKRFSGIPFSMTAHAKDIYLTEKAALNRRIRSADFVLTCTDYNRRHLESISTSDTPIYLSYHGIDLSRFAPHQLPAAANPEAMPNLAPTPSRSPLKILSVGRFCEKKGFPYLLQACCILKDAAIPFHCNIVGFGPLEKQIRQQIQDLELTEVVTLIGKLTQDQVIEQYHRADVFVLPCLVTDDGDRDGIPNVLLEAMATGLPVITTAISGITELVQSEQNGLLVSEKDGAAIATALTRLANDPFLGARLGKAGSRTVHQNFTLELNVGQVKDWLLQTLRRTATTVPYPVSPSLSPNLETAIR
ncbi:glycosyltransferase family 4 protein [Oscillatoria sp. CS-180]|uniref:glycosyltransferase family 4 protein n=1 Tax=Oscillatoria sp. CS-180 TaxID=3021720 RepID=UPI00232CE89A|nr:glycosyltransferase family 4 protein [Oscillatoria sp. CS-180]MDB9527262.1 glycosyltransferase family 4 protein [Oscillatoria sp. CS-180]